MLHTKRIFLTFFLIVFKCLPILICCLVSHFKVDFGVSMEVNTIAIQGAKDGKGYIKSYNVSAKDYADGPWTQYRQNDKTKVGIAM